MIKAIVFDFFGVLANEGTVSFSRAHYPDDKAKLAETNRLQDELNLAVIPIDEYKRRLATLGGVDITVVDGFLDRQQPNKPLLDYIRTVLKPKYKIGIISNSGDDWAKEILGDKDYALFDDILLSYREELIKPDPAIYELSARHLGVKTEEMVFTDDKERYCLPAEALGMKSIVYKDFKQFKTELDKLITAGSDN